MREFTKDDATRLISKMRINYGKMFVYVTAISKGVPRISLSADQFLVSGKNGMVIDDFSDIGRSLTYYLDSFENWNQALVECYELGQKYTTSVLLKKWRKVLNFSE